MSTTRPVRGVETLIDSEQRHKNASAMVMHRGYPLAVWLGIPVASIAAPDCAAAAPAIMKQRKYAIAAEPIVLCQKTNCFEDDLRCLALCGRMWSECGE